MGRGTNTTRFGLGKDLKARDNMDENQKERKVFTIHITAGDYQIELISTHTYEVKNQDEKWLLPPTITIVPDMGNNDTICNKDAQEAMTAINEAIEKAEGKE